MLCGVFLTIPWFKLGGWTVPGTSFGVHWFGVLVALGIILGLRLTGPAASIRAHAGLRRGLRLLRSGFLNQLPGDPRLTRGCVQNGADLRPIERRGCAFLVGTAAA